MTSQSKLNWNDIAETYGQELVIRTDDVHFGVGIPGNRHLGLIIKAPGKSAVDLACGSGENLVALSALGYSVCGLDSSIAQLKRARATLQRCGVRGRLFCADICDVNCLRGRIFDLVLCVGAAHFCSSFSTFAASSRRLLASGGTFVLSLPHPMDMLVDLVEIAGRRVVSFRSYYPDGNRVVNAHYWTKFAGRLELGHDLVEYLYRPSDVINGLIENGFRISGLWEPRYVPDDTTSPCVYRTPDASVAELVYQHVPQYFIVKAIAKDS